VEDIPKLAERFVRRFAEEHGKEVRGVSPDALRCLERYAFPGNIRELENVIERAVALSTAPTLGIGDLPPEVSGLAGAPTPLVGTLPAEGCQLDEVLAEIERRFLLQALERTNGVRTAAAKLLGLTFRSFRYRLAKLGLEALKDEDEPPSSVPSSEP
jgi:two-component system response regulator PilR (NtrC family)